MTDSKPPEGDTVSKYDTNCSQINTENNKTLKNQNSSQNQAQTNICDTQSNIKQSFKTNTTNLKQDKLIILPKIMERPPGCSFIGTTPTTALVNLGEIDGPTTKIIIDSGSDITLVSPQTLEKMPNPPKKHQGKQVKLSQVTAKITISGYVDLPLIFSTDQGPIQANVEAYVVNGMTTPLILGNDFADQYSLSIIRDKGGSTLKFADTGRTMKLENSTSSSHIPEEVKTFLVKVKKGKHKVRNKIRQELQKHEDKPTFISTNKEVIQPFSSKSINYRIKGNKSNSDMYLEVRDFKEQRLTPLQIMDAMVNQVKGTVMAYNPMDCPITINQDEILGKALEMDVLDNNPNEEMNKQIMAFTNFTKAVMRSFKKTGNDQTKEEREYAENQPESPPGPKTAEPPEFEDIPKEQLISALDINPKLTREQKAKLSKILTINHQAFSLDGRIGKYEGINYEIKLEPDASPVSLPPYSASPEKREAIDKQLDKWYSQEVIEASDSPWGAPVIVVYRNGKPRVCIDYRRINAVSQPDEYPLPKQTDILQALMGSQWLSTFDALSGFQQVEVKEEHKPLTAFRCHRGLLQFKRLPFGLRNGPQVFQRIMNKILSTMLWLFVLVYIDDIVVYSKTFEDHLVHLDRVLKAIIKANLTLSPPKCHIGYQSLILLGQRVSRLGMSTHKEKVDAILALVPPKKVSELQSFLGMVNYFSNYIPFYSWITKHLYALLRKDMTWKWDTIHQRAFDLCKEALSSVPVLGYPIPGLGYRLYTDASDHGIGAVLQQIQPIKIKDLKGTKLYHRLKDCHQNGLSIPSLVSKIKEEESHIPQELTWDKNFEETQVWVERVVSYWSKLFKQSEKNYSATEKEALALREALIKFSPVLEGEEIMAITDHSALTWSKTYQSINKRLQNYGTTFSAFPKLKIIHRAGRVHSNVDPISRLHRRIPFYDSPEFSNDPLIELNSSQNLDFYEKYRHKVESMAYKIALWEMDNKISTHVQGYDYPIKYDTSNRVETHLHFNSDDLIKWIKAYEKDKHFSEVLKAIGTPSTKYSQYSLREDGVIMFNNWTGYSRVCVPKSLILEILKEVHDGITGTAHSGYEKTYKRISQMFYWPKMSQDIKKFVFSCPICQQIKHKRHAPYGVLQAIPIPNQPFEVVTMDLITDLPESNGYDAIYVLICKLTKYAFFIPCTTKLSEKDAAKLFFDNIVCHVGLPIQIISDRDSRWRNDFWKEVCQYMGTRRALTTAYHPQADGQTEILNQTVEIALRAYTNFDRNNWSELLPKISFTYNNTPHSATGYSPSQLLYGFKPKEPISYIMDSDNQSIHRPSLDDIMKPESKEFINEFDGMRTAAKDALRRAQAVFENNYNQAHYPISFQIGDQVMINVHSLQLPDVTQGKGKKLTRRFEGPFEVIDKLSDITYQLRIPHEYDIHPVISIAHLEKYTNSPKEFGERNKLEPLRQKQKVTEEFEILEIVKERRTKKRGRNYKEYQCNWKGYGVTEEWIPERNLRNAQELLREWRNKKQRSTGGDGHRED